MLRLKDTLESTVTYALEAGNAAKLGSVAASNYVTTNALSSSTSNITADNAHRLSAYSNNDIANSFFYRNGTPTSGWTGFPSSQLSNASACTPYIGTAFYNKSVSVLHTGGGSGLRRHDLVFLNNSSSSTVDGFLYITNNRNPAYVLDTQNYKSKGNVFGSLTAANSTVTGNQKINGQIQAASSSCTNGAVVNFIASNSTITGNQKVNGSLTALATSASLLYESDTRNDNTPPSTYMKVGRGLKTEFKAGTTIGLSGYSQVITSIPWGDSSGGRPIQIALNQNNLYYRKSFNDTSWDTWNTILDSANYSDYSLSLSGGTLNGGITFNNVMYPITSNNLNGSETSIQYITRNRSYVAGAGIGGAIYSWGVWDSNRSAIAWRVDENGYTYASRQYNAVYNDYAEWFPRGGDTEPGDIIALDTNSDTEQYIKATIDDKKIIGVHSNEYANLIGGEELPKDCKEEFFDYNLKKYIPVGLVGRCRVKVIGPVSKGDDIIPTDIPGVGRAWNESTDSDRLLRKSVGFAVESSTDPSIKLIRVKLTD